MTHGAGAAVRPTFGAATPMLANRRYEAMGYLGLPNTAMLCLCFCLYILYRISTPYSHPYFMQLSVLPESWCPYSYMYFSVAVACPSQQFWRPLPPKVRWLYEYALGIKSARYILPGYFSVDPPQLTPSPWHVKTSRRRTHA
jgi:hypothetical protein